MTIDPALLDEGVTLLRELSRGETSTKDGLAALRKSWPEADLTLLRDQELDGSVAFDLLVREPGGTVSVAFSPAPALPWPQRGAVRYTDQDLLRVGERKLRVGEALGALDFLWYDHDVLGRLVDTCLVQAELEREPVELSDAEVQAAADAYRRARGLLDPGATERWLTARGLSPDDFTPLVADAAEVARLRERIVADRLPQWFAEHRADFDTLVVAWTTDDELDPPASLEAVAAAVREGRSAGVLRVTGQIPTTINGLPVRTVVVDREPAELTGRTRELAGRAVFDEWLAAARAATSVEWFWLGRDRTAGVR